MSQTSSSSGGLTGNASDIRADHWVLRLAPAGARPYLRLARLDRRYATTLRILARRGVVLTAGGFIANRQMLHAHAPAYKNGLPLGSSGDDGIERRTRLRHRL